MTIQNYSIASNDTQNAQQIHASEKMGLPTHVVIMHHGLYKTHLPCLLKKSGKKTYKPARNDDRLNSHIPSILSIWRGNVDCQPVLDIHAIQKYIAKYASK